MLLENLGLRQHESHRRVIITYYNFTYVSVLMCSALLMCLPYYITSSSIPSGRCAWIGASSNNPTRTLRWVEIPPDNSFVIDATSPTLGSTYQNLTSIAF